MKRIKSILALILTLSLVLGIPFTVQAAADDLPYVPLTADATPAANVTVDGTLDTDEWGEPIASWSAGEIPGVDGNKSKWAIWTEKGNTTNQRVEIYVRRNNERMMVAVRLVNSNGLDKPTSTSAWQHAKCRIVFGQYFTPAQLNVETFTYEGNSFERFAGWTVTQTWNESTQSFTKHCTAAVAPGAPATRLSDSDYAIGWDEETRSYVYEFSMTYGTLYNYVSPTNDLMLGVELFDCFVQDNGSSYGNRWFLSDAAHENMELHPGANMSGMTAGMPMRISFNDGSYVNTAVNAMPATAPVLDGSVSTAEWGEPTMVVSADYATSTWADSNLFFGQKAALDPDKRARVWMTNDTNYIYIAGTLDHEQLAPDVAGAWYPQFMFMVGAQGATTDLNQFEYPSGSGTWYERFTKFTINFDKAGTTATTSQSQAYGVATPPTLQADEFEAKYDAATQTFTYEVRIPFSYTNIDPFANPNIRVSFQFTAAHQNMPGDANRITIGGPGCANRPDQGSTPFQGRCLPMALRSNFSTKELLAVGRTTALFEDIDMGDTPIVLQPGAYIDLNGHTLTAKNIRATQGDIIDGLNGQGALIIPKNGTDDEHLLELRAGNRDLALYDTEVGGYRFYTYSFTHQTKTEETVAKFGMQLTFTNNEAYELLADKDAADFDLSVIISSEAMSEDVLYSFTTEVLAEYAAKKLSGDGANWTIVLGVRGIEELTEGQSFTVTPTAKSGTGVGSTATALTFTK